MGRLLGPGGRGIRPSIANNVEVPRAVVYRRSGNFAIEGRQLTAALDCESQQIGISEMFGVRQLCYVHVVAFNQTHSVGPELMTTMEAEFRQKLRYPRRPVRLVRIILPSHDPQRRQLGYRARRPALAARMLKPGLR